MGFQRAFCVFREVLGAGTRPGLRLRVLRLLLRVSEALELSHGAWGDRKRVHDQVWSCTEPAAAARLQPVPAAGPGPLRLRAREQPHVTSTSPFVRSVRLGISAEISFNEDLASNRPRGLQSVWFFFTTRGIYFLDPMDAPWHVHGVGDSDQRSR